MSAVPTPRVVGERAWVNRSFGALAWLVGLIFFFPVFWMVLNSFKTEQDANTSPKLFFHPTLDRYKDVTKSAGGLLSFGEAFTNSAVIVLVSVTIVMLLAIPPAHPPAPPPPPRWPAGPCRGGAMSCSSSSRRSSSPASRRSCRSGSWGETSTC